VQINWSKARNLLLRQQGGGALFRVMAPEGLSPASAALEARVTQLEAQVMRLTQALTQLRRDLGQRVAYLEGRLSAVDEVRRLHQRLGVEGP
jgi:hypothetical protein